MSRKPVKTQGISSRPSTVRHSLIIALWLPSTRLTHRRRGDAIDLRAILPARRAAGDSQPRAPYGIGSRTAIAVFINATITTRTIASLASVPCRHASINDDAGTLALLDDRRKIPLIPIPAPDNQSHWHRRTTDILQHACRPDHHCCACPKTIFVRCNGLWFSWAYSWD